MKLIDGKIGIDDAPALLAAELKGAGNKEFIAATITVTAGFDRVILAAKPDSDGQYHAVEFMAAIGFSPGALESEDEALFGSGIALMTFNSSPTVVMQRIREEMA